MGHPQPKTPVIVDNTTAQGLIKGTMTPKKANEYDMRAAWLKCRQAQRQFNLIWERGDTNMADYHSKTHPDHVYENKRGQFVLN